jgi:3-hydroxyacyl-[acyl-carrier-protein] dehydratase
MARAAVERVPEGTPLEDLDIRGVMRAIPHRFPMLLVDRVVGIEAFRRAVGIKQVTIGEPFFQGHFPSDPIMPGVMIVEAMAQTAAALIVASLGEGFAGNLVYFMGVDEARFRRPVRPGVELRLEVQIQRSRLSVYRFAGRATVGGELAAEAVFSAKMMGV